MHMCTHTHTQCMHTEAHKLSVRLGFSSTSGNSNLALLFPPSAFVVDDEIFVANTCLHLDTGLSLWVCGEQMSRR